MTVISKRFADELSEKEMRDAFLSAQTRAKIALQIRALRNQRGLSQDALGEKMGKPQSNVARLEDREVARYTLTTLFELASAFDVGLIVEFVPYEYFLCRSQDLSRSHLQVESFTRHALDPLCHGAQVVWPALRSNNRSAAETYALLPVNSVLNNLQCETLNTHNFHYGITAGAISINSVTVSASSTTSASGGAISASSEEIRIVPAAVTTWAAPPKTWYAGADRRMTNV